MKNMFLIVVLLMLVVGVVGLPMPVSIMPASVSAYDIPYEIFELRTQTSKTYHVNGDVVRTEFHSGSIHYNNYGWWEDIDTTITETANGWQVTKGHWKLELRPDTTTIISKGGHKLGFRLKSVAYLDIVTKNYHIISQTNDVTPVVSSNSIRWENIFQGVNLEIIYKADKLEESIEVTQAARDALPNPNVYGLNPQNTYLVFIYETDWTDSLPPKQADGSSIDAGNYETELPVYFNDIKNKIVSFLPADYAWAESEPDITVPVRKRLIELGGTHYLLLGSKVTSLNGLAEGTIIIDPSQEFPGSSCDGHVASAARGNYADAHSSSGDTVSATTPIKVGQSALNPANFRIRRGAIFFDTSGLPDSAIPLSASVKMMLSRLPDNDFDLTIVDGDDLVDPLVVADYGDLLDETTSYGNISTSVIAKWVYFTITLNASGVAEISLTGTTKFGLRSSKDIDAISPWAPGTYDFIDLYDGSDDADERPVLTVVYVGIPEVSTLAATAILSTSATLNGNITDEALGNATKRGFDWDIDSGAPYADSWTEDGNYGNGTFSHGIINLTPGVTYYFRAKALNAAGWGYGAELTFTCSAIAPTVSNDAVSNIAATTARLNGNLDDDGGNTTTVYYCWGTTDQGVILGNWDSASPLGVTAEGPFNYDLSGLDLATMYFYRAYAVNAQGNDWADATGNFTTLGGVYTPTNFTAVPRLTGATMDLLWVIGLGSSTTTVRYSKTGYPGNITDGTLVCNTDNNSWAHEDLTFGTTYYYSAWGVSGGNTSNDSISVMATTIAGVADTEFTDTTMPSTWYQSPQYAVVSGLGPIYDMGMDFATGIDMPPATFFLLATIVIYVLFALLALAISKSFFVSAIVLALLMMVGVVQHLVPGWFLLPVGVGVMAILASKVKLPA